MIQFDEHIFQMGWFNHQLALLFVCVFLLIFGFALHCITLTFKIKPAFMTLHIRRDHERLQSVYPFTFCRS